MNCLMQWIVRINKNKVYNWMWCYHRMLLKG